MTKPRQTLTAIGPNGSEVYHPTLLNMSDHYARFLAGKGEVTIATIVR